MLDALVQINEYIDILFTYGPFWVYAAIFAACFIENIVPPFPGDTFIVAAGGLVALDRLDLATSVIVVLAGGMSSVMLIYWFGRRHGRDFFIQRDYKYLSAEDIFRIERKFNRWGAPLLAVSRFVVGGRVALALVAGISRYPVVLMILFSLVSYALFTGLLMWMAYFLVENLDRIQEYVQTYNVIAWPIVILLAVFLIVRQIRRRRRRRSET